jgi:MFS family permease
MSAPRSLASFLALNRTVAVVLISVLFFGLGEQLWERFMPVLLRAQAKPASAAIGMETLLAIGIYGLLRNLFEGFCYIGGGHLTARLGDRGSLLLFGVLTIAGYVLFLTVQLPVVTIIAALLILGWEPLAVPVTFTTVGSTVEPGQRGMAFAIQSIQKRLPRILGPLIAGFVLGAAQRQYGETQGNLAGMQILIGIALALAVASLLIQFVWMPPHDGVAAPPPATVAVRFHPTLRRLLLAEVFTRWCDWLVRDFVVVYLLLIRRVEPEIVGLLMAAQNLTALLTYLPIGRMTRSVGLQPFIGLTFIFFALFPLVLVLCPNEWLLIAFIVYGLREVGEPARKALITSLMPEEARAVGVGLYWGLRSFAICSASLAGALLWISQGPEPLFHAAFASGCIGALIFYLMVGGKTHDAMLAEPG